MSNSNCVCVERKMRRFLPLILSAAFSVFLFLADAKEIYTIQAAAAKNIEQAESYRSEIANVYSPVFIRKVECQTGFPFKICVGYFEFFCEAWIYKYQVKDALKGSFVSGFEKDIATLPPNAIPIKKPFNIEDLNEETKRDPRKLGIIFESLGIQGGKEIDPEILSKNLNDLKREELLAIGLNINKNQQGIIALDKFISTFSNDPDSNKARLRLVRRLLGKKEFDRIEILLNHVKTSDNNDEKAIAELFRGYLSLYQGTPDQSLMAFTEIAGNPSLPPSIRRDGMRRAAGCAHKIRDYPLAWLMFEQIEKNAATVEESSEALMQKAGLAYELVLREIGSWEDVFQLCRSVRETKGAPRNIIATSDLMYLEGLYYNGKLIEALKETERFMDEFKDIAREYYTAMKWRGVFLTKLSRYDEAEQILLDLLNKDIKEEDKFADREPRADAALWLAWIAQQKKNAEKKSYYLNILYNQYAESNAKKEAEKLFDNTQK